MPNKRTKRLSACPYCDSQHTARLEGGKVLECSSCGAAFGDGQVVRYAEAPAPQTVEDQRS